MPNCDEKGRREIRRCVKYRDDGHEDCREYRDDGYNSCENWQSKCCDWWPCSWACKIVSWFCAAWVWISNVVCAAYYWVANLVCVAWAATEYIVCVIVDTIVAALGAILTLLESVIGWFLDILGWFAELFFSIPIIGRFFNSVWNGLLTLFWGAASIVDSGFYFIGIRPEKKLRVCTILLCNERGTYDGIAERSHIVAELNKAIAVFRSAHVRLVRSAPFQWTSGFGSPEQAGEDWVNTYCAERGNDASILDTDCELEGAMDDLWTTGAQLQFILGTKCFFGNFRRLSGYGAPVVVFVVRSVSSGEDNGCASPLWDYVTAQVREAAIFEEDRVKRTITHELAHACNLFHIAIAGNLMNTENHNVVTDVALTTWQQILIRTSRHVTYL